MRYLPRQKFYIEQQIDRTRKKIPLSTYLGNICIEQKRILNAENKNYKVIQKDRPIKITYALPIKILKPKALWGRCYMTLKDQTQIRDTVSDYYIKQKFQSKQIKEISHSMM